MVEYLYYMFWVGLVLVNFSAVWTMMYFDRHGLIISVCCFANVIVAQFNVGPGKEKIFFYLTLHNVTAR